MKNQQIKKFNLYVGLFDKDTKLQKIPTIAARDLIEHIILAAGIDGATISDAIGIYKHDDGSIVKEPSIRVEILFATNKQILTICDRIKIALNQESIALETQIINGQLI